MGKLIRGISKNARFMVIDSTDVVQKSVKIHNSSPTATAALGRVLTAALMMGQEIKVSNGSVTLRIDSDGPAKQLIATADNKGNVKGYIANDKEVIKRKTNGKLDVGGYIGKGFLKVIKDIGGKEPYIGVSPIQTGEIAEDIAYYYFTSEQIPSVVALGVFVDKDMSIKHAGGYIIQLLPGAEEGFITKLEEKIKAIKSVTELMNGGMDPERIAKLLYEDMNSENPNDLVEEYKILDTIEVNYTCDCNKEKFFRGIVSLGKDEIKKLLESQEDIEVECHFCKTKYSYTKEDFELILKNN
ncbi:molecular chaperone Hsp33 [Hypnocyclicus thermotrophus]|uniref:33 kDa chaperonin n=1 Tax=Hypnocyclicus thermotrophus TaxID=1627895 RepID=A0AA46DYV9_9FUSO|nr:Hsp33 family molecular chaperone HslO [Hypnocyclicus thermotrophus]TDT70589.1 molecular chaperone Hsp33 [Hypnocyclicus thermotrophus]